MSHERVVQQRLKGGVEAIVVLVLEIVETTLLDQLHAAIAFEGVLNTLAHLAKRRHAVSHFLDDVVAELCGKRLTDCTVGEIEGNAVKGLNHPAGAKPAKVATIFGIGMVIRLGAGKFLKVGTSLDQLINRIYLSLADCFLLLSSILGEHLQDMLGMDIVAVTHLVDAEHADTKRVHKGLGHLANGGTVDHVLHVSGEHAR